MQKMWVSSVVAGLLVLAPIAAVAQSGGGQIGDTEIEGTTTQEISETEIATFVQEEATDTVGDGEDGEDTGLGQEETTDTVDDGDDAAGESDDHGERVSTVAQCAPTGKLAIEGFANHGAFVSAVARGETVTVEGTTYDLSTAEGVQALCDWAATHEPSDDGSVETTSDHGETGNRPEDAGRPEHAGGPDDAGKPDEAGPAAAGRDQDHGDGEAEAELESDDGTEDEDDGYADDGEGPEGNGKGR